MSFRFWRRVKLLPGVTLNLSKSGGSISLGPRGAKLTLGPRGKRTTFGIPGTGLSYTKTYGSKKSGGRRRTAPPAPRPQDLLTLGFFKRLITPKDEEAFVDGCRELALGDEDSAFNHFKKAAHLADGAFMAGFLALKKNKLNEGIKYFNMALEKHKRLGGYFSKYGIEAATTLSITEEVSVCIAPSLRGVLLALTELYQSLSRSEEAVAALKRLRRLEPEDIVVKLSLAELLMESEDKKVFKEVVKICAGIENISPLHTALLLYKSRALKGLGLFDIARNELTHALRKKKERSKALLLALRYERALVYDALGEKTRTRKDLEKIYAAEPDYEDAAIRLGI